MGSDDSDEENRDRVLAPEDLDITAQPEVEEIDDGRYVVSPDGPAKKPNKDLLDNPDWLNDDDEDTALQRDQPSPKNQSQQPNRDQSPPQNQSQQPNRDQSTPRQPEDGRSSPTRQSAGGGAQSDGRNQQPSGNGQPGGRSQPSSGGSQPSSGGSQPSSGGSQPGGSERQSSRNAQSSSRSQPSSGATQSGDPDQQSSRTSQSSGRGRQASGTGQSAGGGSSPPSPSSSDLAAHNQPPVEPPAVELTNENVSKFLAKELTQGDGDYGFDATLNVEGKVNRGRMTSDDVGETLETLLRWYARQTTDEVEPEAVLGIILAGSDLAVEYPVQSAYTMVKQFDLKPDDTISDLLSAIRKEGSFTIPPSKE